ncbi:lariat debranching enzyme [Gammaproteobacteria bacterium]
MNESPIFFAAVGDIHGHVHRMVELVTEIAQKAGVSISFVLQVGDFQPIRNETDLESMPCPQKYREIGDYPDFDSGKSLFPWPIYFIGGNHEPFIYLDTMPTGGELTRNCYYLGRAGFIHLHGLRVAGLTGIHSLEYFLENHPNVKRILLTKKKLYSYFNKWDIQRLLSYVNVDILLTHDWPKNIGQPDIEIKKRRISSGQSFGNEYVNLLIERLEPKLT